MGCCRSRLLAFYWSLWWFERNRCIFKNKEKSLEKVWDRIKFKLLGGTPYHKEFVCISDVAKDWSCTVVRMTWLIWR